MVEGVKIVLHTQNASVEETPTDFIQRSSNCAKIVPCIRAKCDSVWQHGKTLKYPNKIHKFKSVPVREMLGKPCTAQKHKELEEKYNKYMITGRHFHEIMRIMCVERKEQRNKNELLAKKVMESHILTCPKSGPKQVRMAAKLRCHIRFS